jgi:integration host factor subunit alpha
MDALRAAPNKCERPRRNYRPEIVFCLQKYARFQMSQEQTGSSFSEKFDKGGDENLRTVTRADLAESLHRRTGVGRAEAARILETFLDEIFETIVAREEVKLSSFGAFQVRAKRERKGRNPKTGVGAKISARLVVTFKPSNVLRARINGGQPDGHASPNGDGADGPSRRD